jgi:hypothetical protein
LASTIRPRMAALATAMRALAENRVETSAFRPTNASSSRLQWSRGRRGC